jgi:hypothetical protein
VQAQLDANKARDSLEAAQKAAGLISETTLEREAKKQQSDVVSTLQSSLDFFSRAASFKTDVRANVDAVIGNLDYAVNAFEQRAETWKGAATDRIKNIAGGVKAVSEALRPHSIPYRW